MSNAEKTKYLQSPKWKALREQVLQRDGNKCVVTEDTTNLEIHHISYARLGDEKLSDLVTVSRKVHQKIHDNLGYSRNKKYPIAYTLIFKKCTFLPTLLNTIKQKFAPIFFCFTICSFYSNFLQIGFYYYLILGSNNNLTLELLCYLLYDQTIQIKNCFLLQIMKNALII